MATEDSQPIQITEEYIQKYGVHTVDENGNAMIEVPLGPSNATGKLISENVPLHDKHKIHSGHNIPDKYLNNSDTISAQHFCLTPHTHEIVNLRSIAYNNFVPVTKYANPGFTISKSYNRTFTLSTSISLSGGITKGAVSGELGVEVGGSWSWGEGEEYSAVVPSGYRGRIAYRYDSTMYLFDNKTTYVWSTMPLHTTVEYDACSAESKPHSGYYYMQLIAI